MQKRSIAVHACPVIATTLLTFPPLTDAVTLSVADECRGNWFQPTFVHHDSVSRVYYLKRNDNFTHMKNAAEAQTTCCAPWCVSGH